MNLPARVNSGGRGFAARRGMTVLEVVCGVVLLGLVATAIASTSSLLARMEVRHEQRLGALEVANRLVLRYLDSRTDFEREFAGSPPIEMGLYRYRWDLVSDPVKLELNDKLAEATSNSRSGPQGQQRFELLTVRVWIVDESFGGRFALRGEEMAVLTRLVDPVYWRNPDATDRFVNDPNTPGRIMELMQEGRSARNYSSQTPGGSEDQ